MRISVGVNILALLATIWWTLGGLGYRTGLARLGATLLLAAALFWTEPVQRTLFLGQIELVLMALVMWDMCQPDRRWWKGAGIGVAAGIKLVPLIFIPYLLLTRRFRQAAVAAGTFAATVLLGFAVLPADSRPVVAGRAVPAGRQDRASSAGRATSRCRAFITRLDGQRGGRDAGVAGGRRAGRAGRAGAARPSWTGPAHHVAGVLGCALTGVLDLADQLGSPLGVDRALPWPSRSARCAPRARPAGGPRRALAVGLVAVFGAWPGSLWHLPANTGGFFEGLIWIPPITNPELYFQRGDRPGYAEYHWHGLQLITGNAYVLAGIVLFALLVVLAVRAARVTPPSDASAEADRLTPAAAPPSAG